eukprot:CAMPEP_0174307702 /NCGR_PEP_ID=MMETSP0810-20121108/1291_1 /TAXON_ID=73025 ORGANISM="Eutreptiella gymnastica-like, Strain CCMP1594" /NCGR_SAMPLE_ID=MMETSP0810 /ASSEMBLY_ACC=CAM_ASM_000659 /LENGTH=85 /DNA_ID=CAMNT_0015414833 /DNA_START=2346 /DNA_END=2603 /DNA_ORIENTATION=+
MLMTSGQNCWACYGGGCATGQAVAMPINHLKQIQAQSNGLFDANKKVFVQCLLGRGVNPGQPTPSSGPARAPQAFDLQPGFAAKH